MKKISLVICCSFIMMSMQAQVKISPNVRPQPKMNVPVLKQAPMLVMQNVTFTPAVSRSFFPTQKLHGDNEFTKGNEIYIEFNINFQGEGGNVLSAKIFISGTEFGGDGSSVKGTWEVPLYTAPAGYIIKSVSSPEHSLAFTFDTKDNQRTKIETIGGSCYTHVYDLSASSLGFDLHQSILSDMRITSRNMQGPDISTSEGGIRCGFGIYSISFRPVTLVLEKKAS